jgi:hydrogenase maturation factor
MRWYEEAMWWNIINQTEFEEELVSNVINQIKSTDNEQKYRLVIGSTTVEDSIASIDLAGYLGIGETITDSEASTDENVIVIGGPAINSIAADLLNLDFPTEGLASGIPLNKGIIKVFKNNGKTQILVAGYNAIDTRIAAQAIVQYADQLTDTSIITSGKSLDDISITK